MNSDFLPGNYYPGEYEDDYYLKNLSINLNDKPILDIKNLKITKKGINLFKNIISSKANISFNILDNNISSLKIKHNSLFRNGNYDIKNNIMKVGLFNKDNLVHLLLHVSSSYYDKKNNVYYSGLCQFNDNYRFNYGITEALTDYLSKKYFNIESNSKINVLEEIIEILSYIIPVNMMEFYYFNADCKGFIKYLSNYLEYNEVIKLLSDIDYISKFYLDEGYSTKIDSIIVKIANNLVFMLHKKNDDNKVIPEEIWKKVSNLINPPYKEFKRI